MLNPLDYTRVYASMLSPSQSLESLFALHNANDRPFGQKMRSLSVSDVVVLIIQNEIATGHYVDSFGFTLFRSYGAKNTSRLSKIRCVRYTLTVSVPVGNKAFVLAENPGAVELLSHGRSAGRKGCELGHYYSHRSDAVRDLYRRVNGEKDFRSSSRQKKEKEIMK
jgi:hypothetical protein